MAFIVYGGLAVLAAIGMFFLPVKDIWIMAIGFIIVGSLLIIYGIRRNSAEDHLKKSMRLIKERKKREENRKALEDRLR